MVAELATGWILVRLSAAWFPIRLGMTIALALAAAAILAYAIRNTYLLITGKGADKSLTQ